MFSFDVRSIPIGNFVYNMIHVFLFVPFGAPLWTSFHLLSLIYLSLCYLLHSTVEVLLGVIIWTSRKKQWRQKKVAYYPRKGDKGGRGRKYIEELGDESWTWSSPASTFAFAGLSGANSQSTVSQTPRLAHVSLNHSSLASYRTYPL